MDKGPWRAAWAGDRACVRSEDFEHDVMLKISGDFEDHKQLHEYAAWLATTLNKATPSD